MNLLQALKKEKTFKMEGDINETVYRFTNKFGLEKHENETWVVADCSISKIIWSLENKVIIIKSLVKKVSKIDPETKKKIETIRKVFIDNEEDSLDFEKNLKKSKNIDKYIRILYNLLNIHGAFGNRPSILENN